MKIKKNSRHQKIIGNFGENLICNWLSRSGFEVAIVDHTGIDIVAYNSSTKTRLGITVKSRTRTNKTKQDSVNLLKGNKQRNSDRKKLNNACRVFACEPWIAVYVETESYADIYLTSLENYDINYRGRTGRNVEDWKMGNRYLEQYFKDSNVKHIKIDFTVINWDWK